MSISIGPAPILDDLVLWYDAANYKCYSGEPTTNQFSRDYYGESGVSTGDASLGLSGLFGLGIISQRPWSHEVWSEDNINKGKLTRYGAYYFDGINDYLEVPDDDAFTFGQDNVSVYTSDFSAGDDGWTAGNAAAAGNIDSIGPGGDLRDDNLRLTVNNATNTIHYLQKSIIAAGKTYIISFDYYIPSTNSNLDSIELRGGTGTTTATGSTLDAWTSLSGTASVTSDTSIYIYGADGGAILFQDAGADDVMYIRNVQITEIKDDLPFSIGWWGKPTSGTIIGKSNSTATAEWHVTYLAAGKYRLYIWTDASNYIYYETEALGDLSGQWHSGVFTVSGSGPNSANAFGAATVSFYLNGVSKTVNQTDAGTHTGMSNKASTVRVGYSSFNGYHEGHIKNVKIFNRELNAGEVYQLYYNNSLNGVIYSSDFSEGVNGWTGDVRLTSAGNIDSIGGKNNNLRLTITDTTNNTHYTTRSASVSAGKRMRVSLEVYIPSTNSNADGIRVGDTINNQNFINSTPSQDTWVLVSGEAVANNATLLIGAQDGGSNTFTDAGGDDVIYIRNINVVELDNQSLVDFADEWGEANGGTYTSDFSAGVDGFTGIQGTADGNIDSIGGLNDNIRLTINSTSAIHYLNSNTAFTITKGKKYRISYDAYIPTQSNVDGHALYWDGATLIKAAGTGTLDSWVNYTYESTAPASAGKLYWIVSDGASITVNDAGGDDVFYIRNVTVTQIGILADFDLANYDDNDKVTDRSSNKFVASPQGGALARERGIPYSLSFQKDKDNNDIATITRNPASGAFYENTNSLTLFGEHPLYITNASTGDKASISLQTKSNLTGLFTGINFFNSGTSANEIRALNRITLPDGYEYIYGTSNLIATGDNVGFELLMDRSMSSGWNYISLRKPQTELKDHATNFTSFSRTGTNAIINLANRSQYAGTIVNNVKSSGIAKIDGIESFVPLINGYWEFNGVDTNINASFINYNDLSKEFTIEFVFLIDTTGQNNTLAGFNDYPYFYGSSSSSNKLQFFYNATSKQGETELTTSNKQHAVFQASNITKSGNLYLNGQFDGGFSFSDLNPADTSIIYIGDKGPSEAPFDGRIFLARYYDKFLTSDQINHNYRSIKTKYGL